jgi:hypothetical protein
LVVLLVSSSLKEISELDLNSFLLNQVLLGNHQFFQSTYIDNSIQVDRVKRTAVLMPIRFQEENILGFSTAFENIHTLTQFPLLRIYLKRIKTCAQWFP